LKYTCLPLHDGKKLADMERTNERTTIEGRFEREGEREGSESTFRYLTGNMRKIYLRKI